MGAKRWPASEGKDIESMILRNGFTFQQHEEVVFTPLKLVPEKPPTHPAIGNTWLLNCGVIATNEIHPASYDPAVHIPWVR
jgi:hypothetical protein